MNTVAGTTAALPMQPMTGMDHAAHAAAVGGGVAPQAAAAPGAAAPQAAAAPAGGGALTTVWNIAKEVGSAAIGAVGVASDLYAQVNRELANESARIAGDPKATINAFKVQELNNRAWLATTMIEQARKTQDYHERSVSAWTAR